MSHQPERKDKDCLNCRTIVQGRYCHNCGQENVVNHQSFLSLVKHFIYDIFHFDGKFFDTLRYLLFRPGKVPKEYVQGKRVKYLEPIKMYLFTSTLFFLVFFILKNPETSFDDEQKYVLSNRDRLEVLMDKYAEAQKQPVDTLLQEQIRLLLDSTQQISLVPWNKGDTGMQIQYKGVQFLMKTEPVNIIGNLNTAPDNWISRAIEHKISSLKQKHGDDLRKGILEIVGSFLQRIPYLLFISLPFSAAVLQLLYSKHKNLIYSDHAVFTLYHYIFSFILLLLIISFESLGDWLGWNFFNWLIWLCILLWVVYLFIAMKRFYGQSVPKTFGKFLLLNVLGFFIMVLLFLLFIIFSISQI